MKENIYIIGVHPMFINSSLVWDLFYLSKGYSKVKCIRIYNIQLSFMIARLPGLDLDQFERIMKKFTRSLHTEIRTNLVDSSYFNFNNNREYLEIFSSNPEELNSVYISLNKYLQTYYKRIKQNTSSLSPNDYIFYKNTETPFRFTSTTLSIQQSIYNLSTKYDIPLVGGAVLDTSLLTDQYPTEFKPNSMEIHGLDAQITSKWNYDTVNKNISNAIQKNDRIDFKENMTLLAYDIETYNPTGNLDPSIADQYIFAIGIGLFNLTSNKPNRRISLISKSFNEANDTNNNTPLKVKHSTYLNRSALNVYNEYSDNKDDFTTYVFTDDEKDLLQSFIECLRKFKPQIITGFNTFGFDDNYVYTRMDRYGLTNDYLQCYTYYDISPESELLNLKWFKPFIPTFREFELKIDGEPRRDNKSIRAPIILNVDVFKLMLKEDPKRFTQYGRGNLDTMLSVYDIRNPYTNESLSKTGLKIHEMYRRWDNNENIYSIALYCCQDAWITGTLLISRSKLADLIEMSMISNTSLSDSLYKADGVRVANSILGYAYKENFASMDSPYIYRGRDDEQEKKNLLPALGGKVYDHRTIVGGQVRNIHAGRQWFVVALDYSSMYPANKEASNVDSSSRVDEDMIKNPDKYGLNIVRTLPINDMYGNREVYYIKTKK